jgi:methylated-DNA-[protein]-cysteine S-methyltransferase
MRLRYVSPLPDQQQYGTLEDRIHGPDGPELSDPHGTITGMEWIRVPAPIGEVGVAADERGICAVQFGGLPRGVDAGPGTDPRLAEAARQLTAYFTGELTDFRLPLHVRGGSDFERAVWQAIAAIPYGEMRTYGEMATAVGDRDAARAVGVACNRNPLPIVVPCHRVVGAGGKLVGFGGGLPRKRLLLELEARVRVEHTFS